MLQEIKRSVIKIEKLPTTKVGSYQHYKTVYYLKCQRCEKIFTVFKKKFTQGVGKYCSMACFLKKKWVGSNNPNWKGGITPTLDIQLGESHRKRLFKIRGYKCEHCGFSKFKECLEIDHINPRGNGGTHNSKNLMILCANCHKYKTKIGKLPTSY